MYSASYLAVVEQVGDVSSGGYPLIFWMFQDPTDLIFSLIKGMAMATVIVLVGCYYGYTASGGPVGVGTATAQVDGLQHRRGPHPRACSAPWSSGAPTRRADRRLSARASRRSGAGGRAREPTVTVDGEHLLTHW